MDPDATTVRGVKSRKRPSAPLWRRHRRAGSASAARLVLTGLLGGAALAAAIGLAAAQAAPGKYMPASELRPGMKGYGLTVFSGTKPERFSVEIISTLHNFRPNQDLIIVKTDHPRLRVARTVAGMSGSPVYVNGRMIGAYAYGWYFGSEPVAGVTPIHDMLADLRRPMPRSLAPKARRGPLPGSAPRRHTRHTTAPSPTPHRYSGRLLDYDGRRHAEQVAQRTAPALAAPGGTALGPASTPVLMGGLSSGSFRLAQELLEPIGLDVLQAGGSGSKKTPSGAPARFVDGGVLAVELVRGDLSASGLGTVTHVVGDKLIGFGHPLLHGGWVNFPTAVGKVHWVLATQNRSFKIGEPTQPLGALINDRQASVVVDMSRTAPVFPVEVHIQGVPGVAKPRWSMEVAHDPFLAPNFTAIAIGSALETTTSERQDLTWRATSKLSIAGRGTIRIEDFGAGNRRPIGPSDFSRSRLTEAMGALLNNPWEELSIAGVDTTVRVSHRREVMKLRGAQVLESEIDAGRPARIRLTLQHYRGKTEIRVIEVPIPASFAGQTVEIKLQPGHKVERILPAPENVADLVHMLPRLRFDSESVVASYRLKDGAATFRGKVARRLPPGAVDTLRSSTQSVAPEVFTATRQVAFPIRGFLTGQDTVRVKVRHVLR